MACPCLSGPSEVVFWPSRLRLVSRLGRPHSSLSEVIFSSFYRFSINKDPGLRIEFFPPTDSASCSPELLNQSLPENPSSRVFALPDGKVFMVTNNQSIIYDVEANTETILPDIPNNVRATNPIDGSAILLPLSPPDFIPEAIVCGGMDVGVAIEYDDLSSEFPATSQCSRIKLTPEGIAKGWEVEHMLEGRTMPELVHPQ